MQRRPKLILLAGILVATAIATIAQVTQIPGPSGGSGSPAGSTNQIQIFSGGVFGASTATADAAGNVKARHLLGFGTAPSIASGAGTGTVAGFDLGGRVTLAGASSPLSVVINFGTAFTTAPACIANDETGGTATVIQASATTTQLTLMDQASTAGANDKLTWVCVAY